MNLAAIRKVQLQRVLSASRSSLQQVRAGSSATSYQSRQFSSSTSVFTLFILNDSHQIVI